MLLAEIYAMRLAFQSTSQSRVFIVHMPELNLQKTPPGQRSWIDLFTCALAAKAHQQK